MVESASPKQVPEEVASLLIPMGEWPVLLPNVAVVEIIPYIAPRERLGAPDWYFGDIVWRELKTPLICFESLNGAQTYELKEHARIAMINGVKGDTRLPFYALVVQGIPRLARVSPPDIESMAEKTAIAEASRVRINGERAVIPDLDYIEQQILALP